jgi:peptidoglycan/xylan/chitin deacetylase (PgdA/CDA1 family)
VGLDRFTTLYLARPLGRLGRDAWSAVGKASCCKKRLPILMYHSISDDPEPGMRAYYRLCTSPRRFAEQMEWIKHAGYRGVTLREGLAWLNAAPETHSGESAQDPRPVVLTFDDGFRDFHTAAWPVLQQHGFAATVFLPTAFIGETRRVFAPARTSDGCPTKGAGRECLTWPEVRELHRAGIEFGSHTVHHRSLGELCWSEVERQTRDSKLEIESRVGAPVLSFAHPYAFPWQDPARLRRLAASLQGLGYTNAVTTRIGRVRPEDDRFALRRLPVNDSDDPEMLAAKLAGHYDWLAVAQAVIKLLKWQLRRARQRSAAPVPRLASRP